MLQVAFSAPIQLQNKIIGLPHNDLFKNIQQNLLPQKPTTQLTKNDAYHLFQKNKKSIKAALKPYGYFHVHLNSTLSKTRSAWIATYHIHLGTATRIKNIHIQITGPGRHEKKLLATIDAFVPQTGQQLNTNEYMTSKQHMLTIANQLGYLDAHFLRHEIIVNRHTHQAYIHLTLDTGHRYYFGPVHFGKTPFSKTFLSRYIHFKQGQPYSYLALVNCQDDLSGSGYFQRVDVMGNKKLAVHYQIPILVTLHMRKSQLYSFGIGYGTDTRFRTSFGWDWRWTNPYGHYITSVIALSQVQSSFIARYVIPGKNPVNDQYNFVAAYQTIKFGTARSAISQFGTNYVTKKGHWRQSYSLSYQLENSTTSEDKKLATQYLLPDATWVYTQTNKPYFATKGYRLSLSLRGASQAVFSKTNFVQGTFRARDIRNFWHGFRFLTRAEIGYTIGNKLTDLPPSLQFWTGGIKSVRGYSYLSIGPGKYLLTASAELQRRIYKQWYASIFYDLGNAFNRYPIHALRGIGVGAVWLSPVGPLELSVARAIDLPKRPFRVQFSMGADL